VIGLRRINKSSRLVVVDDLQEGATLEHILHIKLMNWPGARNGQGEHGVDRGRLDHRTEGLNVVDAGSLGEAAMDPASLIPFQRVIGVELVLKNLFVGDDVGANGARNKIPCVVGDQGSKLFFHGAAPVWIDEGDAEGGGHQRQG
jgi:hypothetical protein